MRIRERMPALKGATAWLNGEVRQFDLVGQRPTLIHFWSVSCHLCKEAMPKINEFRDCFKEELNILAVHMPLSKDDLNLSLIRSSARELDMIQSIFVDSELKLSNTFNNEYVPAYYVFDKRGLLRHFQAGERGLSILEKRINRLLLEAK